eukprot:4396963-Amphidinium_carterae.1
MWQTWSTQSPAQRVQEQLTKEMPMYGFCPPPENSVEAVLRTCLQDVLPKGVVDKCMVDQKVSSKELLLETMKAVMPKYHTVRVALLDSMENQNIPKVSSVSALHQSLKEWMEVLKLAMRRYNLQPEPRRAWLSIWARVVPLYESHSGLAAVIERHLQGTQ